MNVMHNRLMALALLLFALTPSSYSQDNEVMDLAITNVSVIDVVSGGGIQAIGVGERRDDCACACLR